MLKYNESLISILLPPKAKQRLLLCLFVKNLRYCIYLINQNTMFLTNDTNSKIAAFLATLNKEQQLNFNQILDLLKKELSGDDLKHKKPKTESNNIEFDSKDKTTLFQLQNCSLISPLRKKLNFSISYDSQHKCNNIILSDKDDKVHFSINNTKSSIRFATFLPVLEKPNLCYFFIKHGDDSIDPLIMTLNKQDVVKQLYEDGENRGLVNNDDMSLNERFEQCISYIRKQTIITGFKVINPFQDDASSDTLSLMVDAHIKSKEGALYFLPGHLLFGFKKPILLLDLGRIKSVNYSTITRLTFSLNLVLDDDTSIEFSMIDQQEYDKINTYISMKRINDQSLSESLKAKTNVKQESKGDLQAAIAENEDIQDVPMEDADSDDPNDEEYIADIDNIDGSEYSSDEEEPQSKPEKPASEVLENEIEPQRETEDIEVEVNNEENSDDDYNEDEDSGVEYD